MPTIAWNASWGYALGFVLTLAACGHTEPPPAQHPSQPSAAATLTYLGVAGWSLHDERGTLLVDPLVSRAHYDNETIVQPDEAAIARFLPERADAILVSHSHWDHLLDAPAEAKRSGAVIVGTESTANVARASGLPDGQIRIAQPGARLMLGAFDVQVLDGLHSLTGQDNVPIPREITLPMAIRDYGQGGTLQYLVRFAGHTILFIGSANFREEAVRDLHPDIAVIATGLREKIPDYTCRLLRLIGAPKQIYTNHWDAFLEPLRPGENGPDTETQADLDAFANEVRGCAPETRVTVPVHLQPIAL